jgi:hypothetical protein
MTHDSESSVRERIRQVGALPAFRQLIAENDRLIRGPELNNGRGISSARTAIYTGLVGEWALEQHRAFGYDKPFGVVALGGTGRGEMAPCSDLDFAFLFEDALEGNPFLLELQRQALHSGAFESRFGFKCMPLPFRLDDLPALAGKQLNSFLDMRPVYDPCSLAGLFRERIRATFDSFEHFLHVRGFWEDQWEKATRKSERLDRFDIKNEGLRLFLAGIWTLAGRDFRHSHEVYQELEDPRDLEAYDFLLRIRSFVHSRRTGSRLVTGMGNHPEDMLGFEDFISFGEMLGPDADEGARFEFANEVRARLLSARRRVARFATGVIEGELKAGRVVSLGNPIVNGVGGLYHSASPEAGTPELKSRAALSLVLASQHYGVRIDPLELQRTFRGLEDWLVLVPELCSLFYEQRGSAADSFEFLAQFDGAEERLFPGYARFEASLDGRVMCQRQSLRGALERQKTRALERYVRDGRAKLSGAISARGTAASGEGVEVELEAALLDADHLAAIKLALKTKRLPLTPQDQAVRLDATRELHERYSTGLSGIPLSEYYEPYCSRCEFPRETLRIVEFLVLNRRAFKDRAEAGINDARQVAEFVELCGSENLLRALFVFTCADRVEWESEQDEPARWFNTRELYAKAMARFRPAGDPARSLQAAGYAPDQLDILRDFGEDFFTGVYRQYANRFGSHLVRLAQEPEKAGPRASILREGASIIVGIAARDYRGLAASISGAFCQCQVRLRQAHLFSATRHHLVLDFFHVTPGGRQMPPHLTKLIEEAIKGQLHIADSDEAGLPAPTGLVSLREWRPGQYCLRLETSDEPSRLIYALTYRVFRYLRGNIFGLTAHTGRDKVYASVYHSLPPDLPVESAQAIVEKHF